VAVILQCVVLKRKVLSEATVGRDVSSEPLAESLGLILLDFVNGKEQNRENAV
jgi:hypothetical protein